MKITNNHKGPLGLPDGTILLPGEATPIANWDALKGNAVVQGWLKGKILTAEGGKTSSPAPETLYGSNVLPANIELAEGVAVQLGEVVRLAHEASGLTIADWNALDDGDREARLSATVLELQSAAEAEAEAKKGEADAVAAAAAAAEAEKAKASSTAGSTAQSPPAPDKKDALIARAKALGIDAKGTWGMAKLESAIAEAEDKKGEG
ncbi:hypothetical protein [Stenotrophomonas maltophilia]|uniref:hypothetical protein n=1 Tax=Stenotrophomonas maltophilia TaxID=40324 RepID=UPI000C2595E7|nr:hypothetical protein [Stenotrophomonas maltophilia]PJL44743.1 hypothetical protein B9Y56_08650 [Stenotrophomonas maltophilia]